MKEPLRVLCLEDDPDFAEFERALLEMEGFHPEVVMVDNRADFLASLERSTFDIILADYQLPTGNGLQLLQAARKKAPDTPFLLVSGVVNEQMAIEVLKSGATDYVHKSDIDCLVPAVHRAVHAARERKWAAEELKKAQDELARASRLAGMAEAATSVLHDVGKVLNSLNISVSRVSDELKKSRIANVAHVAALMRDHAGDIGEFMAHDSRGQKLPEYLNQLAEYLAHEQAALLREMADIRRNVDLIKDIVAIQQDYSRLSAEPESVRVTDLMEDALRMNAVAPMRYQVKVITECDPDLPEVTVPRHKVLQILVNLIRNAKCACDESNQTGKGLTLRVSNRDNRVRIAVIDNGVGIPAENLTRIFDRGFTTRKGGHGLGLHNNRLAAQEMGGTLLAHSDGPGRGATFTLELPLHPPVPASSSAAPTKRAPDGHVH
jgi:signal transduction histidine kinase